MFWVISVYFNIRNSLSLCVCVRACVRACVCVGGGAIKRSPLLGMKLFSVLIFFFRVVVRWECLYYVGWSESTCKEDENVLLTPHSKYPKNT